MDSATPLRLFVNGKFLRSKITGTIRVAEEILAAWNARLAADSRLRERFDITVLRPTRRIRDLGLEHIVERDVDWVGGRLWEHVDLPLAARKGVLLNFGNIAPFMHSKNVVYLHDAQIFHHSESYTRSARLLQKPLMIISGLVARRVITLSNFSAKMLARHRVANPSKTTVIYNGADHILRAEINEDILRRFGLSPQSYVLMFGSSFPYKNNRIVYEAYRRLGQDAPHLAVIGRADERLPFGNILDLSSGKVSLMQDVSDDALRTLYTNAIVFAAPSRTEGYPITQLEALNCGCPVITTPEASMPEVLGDSVDYAGADDAEAWVTAIRAFASEPQRRALSLEKGRRVAGSKTWAHAAERLLNEIESHFRKPT